MQDIQSVSRFRRLVILSVAVLCLIVCESAELAAQQTNEVVVLKNGGIFMGKVVERERMIIVQLPRGGEVRLNPATVDFRAPSIQDVYAVLVRRSTAGDPKQHLGLFDWCISQSLLREADIQLESAARSGADQHAVDRRRRHLNSLFDAERQRLMDAMQRPAGSPTPQRSSDPVTGEAERQSEPRRFSPSMPAAEIEAVDVEEPKQNVSSNQERDQFEFSEEVFVAFRRQIQPRLIHGCAASSCHGPTAQGGFELARVARGRPVTRGMTERNIREVMKLINPKSPHSSTLLRVVTELHAGRGLPIIPRHESEHYQELETWVVQTGQSMRSQLEEIEVAPELQQGYSEVIASIPRIGANGEFVTSDGERNIDPQVKATGFSADLVGEPGAGSDPNGNGTPGELSETAMSSQEAGLAKPPFRPIDAFDPEIFNRYAKGELKSQSTPEPIEIIPIPDDPIGSPTSQIAPPSRVNSPDDNANRN